MQQRWTWSHLRIWWAAWPLLSYTLLQMLWWGLLPSCSSFLWAAACIMIERWCRKENAASDSDRWALPVSLKGWKKAKIDKRKWTTAHCCKGGLGWQGWLLACTSSLAIISHHLFCWQKKSSIPVSEGGGPYWPLQARTIWVFQV
jgi:hypothetical protein